MPLRLGSFKTVIRRKAKKGEPMGRPPARAASPEQAPRLLTFYHDIIAASDADAGWQVGSYPTLDMLEYHCERGELFYIGEVDAAFVLTSELTRGYDDVPWRNDAAPDQIASMHMVGVHPSAQGKGMGRIMMREAARIARSQGCTVLRLDVYPENLPAVKFYEAVGMTNLGRHTLEYEGFSPEQNYMFEMAL